MAWLYTIITEAVSAASVRPE